MNHWLFDNLTCKAKVDTKTVSKMLIKRRFNIFTKLVKDSNLAGVSIVNLEQERANKKSIPGLQVCGVTLDRLNKPDNGDTSIISEQNETIISLEVPLHLQQMMPLVKTYGEC